MNTLLRILRSPSIYTAAYRLAVVLLLLDILAELDEANHILLAIFIRLSKLLAGVAT